VKTAAVPFLGIYTKDLEMLAVAHESILKTGMINWQKQKKIYEIILTIQNFQVTPYYFKKIEDVYSYLQQLYTITQSSIYRTHTHAIQSPDAGSERWLNDVLYDLSLRFKPSKSEHPTYKDSTEI